MSHRPTDADAIAGAGRSLATPGRFIDDDGSPDEAIREAHGAAALLDALRHGRVLVAVTAVATEVDEHGADKESDMAVVSMVAPDGRRGLLAFSGIDAMQAWDTTARPVPTTGVDAARAALDDHCDALVVDVAGPRTQVVIESGLLDLAGVDPLEHAAALAQRSLDEHFGADAVRVQATADRLVVESHSLDGEVVAEALYAWPRVLALVPGGMEVRAAQ